MVRNAQTQHRGTGSSPEDPEVAAKPGSTENEALRTSLLATLWATYALSPVTEANVAGLLDSLNGIVEEPAEVDAETAEGALQFLLAVLRANRNKNLGLPDDSTEFVASILSNLFDTAPFNASEAVSLEVAANASVALNLASTAQL